MVATLSPLHGGRTREAAEGIQRAHAVKEPA